MRRGAALAALILAGIVILVWLDAWLLGSLVMIGAFAKSHGAAFATPWLHEWVSHPLASAWFIVSAQGSAGVVGRTTWLLAHIPLIGGLGYVAYLFRSNRADRAPAQAAAYGSHGTAEYDNDKALAQRFAADGPGLLGGRLPSSKRDERQGKPPRWLIHPIGPGLNQFVLILGSSGSYKTSNYVIPNTLHEEHASMVISDPKGEIYRETAAVKEAQGYKVLVVDFDRKHLSARQNPLDYVRRPEDALTVASVIIANTDNPNRPTGADQSFWDQAEQALMTALILYIKLHRPQQEHNLGSVLSMGAELTQDELNSVFDALPHTDPARKYYRTFRQAEDKVRSSILIGFATRLQLWNLDEIEQMTATSDFDLASIGREKTVLYVIFPLDARARPLMPLMALLWTQLCDELLKLANSQPSGALPVTCRLRIDEAANIGHIPDLELRVSTTRGLGIWWELVFQTLGQFKARYPRTWAEIAGSCDTTLYLGGNDQETVEYISRRLGSTTIQVQSLSQSHNRLGTSTEGQGASYTGRPLMTPDEIAKLPADKAILLQRSRNPAVVLKAFYKLHPLAAHIESRPPAERVGPEWVEYRVLNPKELLPIQAVQEETQQKHELVTGGREARGRRRGHKAENRSGSDPLGFLKKEGGQQK